MEHRRTARRAALQALFEIEQTKHDPESVLTNVAVETELSKEGVRFAESLIRGVLANKAEIDGIIEKAAPAWPIGQVAITDRVALEIGVFEARFEQSVPMEVAINEAVELAKVFGGENSAGFVNGVLRTTTETTAGSLTK